MEKRVKRRAWFSREKTSKQFSVAQGELQALNCNRGNTKSGHLEKNFGFFCWSNMCQGNKDVTVNPWFHATPTQCSYCTLVFSASYWSACQAQEFKSTARKQSSLENLEKTNMVKFDAMAHKSGPVGGQNILDHCCFLLWLNLRENVRYIKIENTYILSENRYIHKTSKRKVDIVLQIY